MTKTQNFAVLGLQWGDEGKGKIVNFLSPNFHATCRFQGGHNAGPVSYTHLTLPTISDV